MSKTPIEIADEAYRFASMRYHEAKQAYRKHEIGDSAFLAARENRDIALVAWENEFRKFNNNG